MHKADAEAQYNSSRVAVNTRCSENHATVGFLHIESKKYKLPTRRQKCFTTGTTGAHMLCSRDGQVK